MNEKEALVWIADVFQMPADSVTASTVRKDIPAWDSLGVLTLIANLDETFDILLEDPDLQSMKTVGDILEILRKYHKLNSGIQP
jgi:acyl carrier protein